MLISLAWIKAPHPELERVISPLVLYQGREMQRKNLLSEEVDNRSQAAATRLYYAHSGQLPHTCPSAWLGHAPGVMSLVTESSLLEQAASLQPEPVWVK